MADETPETGSAQEADGTAKKEKLQRTPGDRAVANLRSARRIQKDIADPAERSRVLLAEANVLALLDLADALRRPGGSGESS
jgi:hypothetical protein